MNRRDLLLPLSPLYSAAVHIRGAAYRYGWLERKKLPVPVISVGNLTFGGTGKTPTVIALVRDLVRRGRRPAVLTRGYGRQTDEPLFLVGPDTRETPERAGDEPLELASRLPGVPVVVDADRFRGGRRAIKAGAEILLLDDGFQHLKLVRDLDLVLIDASDPWGGGHVPPRGRLREPLSALRRASAVLVTKLDKDATQVPTEIVKGLKDLSPGMPVFGARLTPERVHTPQGLQDPDVLSGQRVFAVAALGRPEGFRALLESAGAEVVGAEWFPDHHLYDEKDVERVISEVERLGAVLTTTAKDAVKLPKDIGAWVIEVSMKPIEGAWDRFWMPCREITG
ncbi:MAG: tetraacyldisaccharide 4'-kinase [Thermoanaerobaculales bacterium]|nr:tetraacyldisaccharide 4'-kinase [Thermoanaerobaculales bacterium]